jgi:hypothetical protein
MQMGQQNAQRKALNKKAQPKRTKRFTAKREEKSGSVAALCKKVYKQRLSRGREEERFRIFER